MWIYFCCSSNTLLLSTDVLKYEPCVYPPALFEATGTMLQFDKPSQTNAIQGWVPSSSTQIPQDVSYIYDRDALIHKSPWKTGQTYESLCGKYTEYVKKEIWPTNFLCDGYPDGPSAKDNFHLRWKKSSGSTFSYSKEASWVHCLKMIPSPSKWTNGGTFLCWVMEWWHLLELIRSMLKSN